MTTEFIKDKVYYKVFDLSHKDLSYIYNKNKYTGDAAKLAEIECNLRIVKEQYKANEILVLNQTHSSIVVNGIDIDCGTNPVGDASITKKPRLVLAVQTADCVPVLFSCANGLSIGAAHCGWRSAKADIIKETVEMMRIQGAQDIKAIIGPSILQASYEVDSNYYKSFLDESQDYADFFIESNKENHYRFDLPAFVKYKLLVSKVKLFDHIAEDTYSNPEKYPSYRRSCHDGEKYSQNILSTIMIR